MGFDLGRSLNHLHIDDAAWVLAHFDSNYRQRTQIDVTTPDPELQKVSAWGFRIDTTRHVRLSLEVQYLEHYPVRRRVLTLAILADLFGEAMVPVGTMPEAAARLFRRATPIPRAPQGRAGTISNGENPFDTVTRRVQRLSKSPVHRWNGNFEGERADLGRVRPRCRTAGVFETGFHMISMPYPKHNCETESLLMRTREKHAEVSETKLQPYGS